MAGKAKYIIMIPKVDNLGQPLVNIAQAAHHQMFYGPLKVQGSYIDPDKMGHWRDEDPEPHDLLVTYAEDTPEMDSHVKQIALEVAEFANQWGIFVVKEGKNGIADWVVDNPKFRQGEGAEPSAIQQPMLPSPQAPVPPAQGESPGQPPAAPQEAPQDPSAGLQGLPQLASLRGHLGRSQARWRLTS